MYFGSQILIVSATSVAAFYKSTTKVVGTLLSSQYGNIPFDKLPFPSV